MYVCVFVLLELVHICIGYITHCMQALSRKLIQDGGLNAHMAFNL